MSDAMNRRYVEDRIERAERDAAFMRKLDADNATDPGLDFEEDAIWHENLAAALRWALQCERVLSHRINTPDDAEEIFMEALELVESCPWRSDREEDSPDGG